MVEQAPNEQGEGTETEGTKLRKQLEAALARNAELEQVQRHRTIRDAGFADLDNLPLSVKLVADAYEGDWSDTNAFREFVTSAGVSLPQQAQGQTPAGQQPESPPSVTSLTEAEQQRLATTSRIDQIGQLSQSDQTPSLQTLIAEADLKLATATDPNERQAAIQEAMRLKNQWAAEIRQR